MITVHVGDITALAVDAIVNAANTALIAGGGVDGAIHDAAGPELQEACLRLPEVEPGVRCPTGEARVTPGFALLAPWIIHTVGLDANEVLLRVREAQAFARFSLRRSSPYPRATPS